MPHLGRLGALHLDALREMANIGAGHAATALSQMTGRRVSIGVPSVTLAARRAVAEIVGSEVRPMILVRLAAGGRLAAGLVLAFTEEDARALTDLLLARRTSSTGWLDPLGTSALKEVGNVLGAAYLNVLARLTGWTIPLSTPDLVYARADWATDMLRDRRCEGDEPGNGDCWGLCLETTFHVDGSEVAVKGHVLLFPGQGSVEALLVAVGVE